MVLTPWLSLIHLLHEFFILIFSVIEKVKCFLWSYLYAMNFSYTTMRMATLKIYNNYSFGTKLAKIVLLTTLVWKNEQYIYIYKGRKIFLVQTRVTNTCTRNNCPFIDRTKLLRDSRWEWIDKTRRRYNLSQLGNNGSRLARNCDGNYRSQRNKFIISTSVKTHV